MEYELAMKILEMDQHDLEFLLRDLAMDNPEAMEFLKEKLEDVI